MYNTQAATSPNRNQAKQVSSTQLRKTQIIRSPAKQQFKSPVVMTPLAA